MKRQGFPLSLPPVDETRPTVSDEDLAVVEGSTKKKSAADVLKEEVEAMDAQLGLRDVDEEVVPPKRMATGATGTATGGATGAVIEATGQTGATGLTGGTGSTGAGVAADTSESTGSTGIAESSDQDALEQV